MLPAPEKSTVSLPKMMRDWREQLNEVGVDDATIEYFGIHPVSGGYVAYDCEYPPRVDHSANQVKYDRVERGRLLPDALKLYPDKGRFFNPKVEEMPTGEMPFFYTPNYSDLRMAVMDDNGILYGFEGDKDTWTAYASGIKNVAGVLSAGARIDDRLALQLQEMGVKTFRYYPDADNAGWNLAERIADILSKYSIALQVFHLPFYVNEKLIKDTSDIWKAVDFNKGEYLKILSGLRQIKLASQEQREKSEKTDYFDERLYEDIERELGFTSADYKGNDGWPKRSVPCRKQHHEHDDHHPAYAWNRTKHIGRCFKCGETWLAKEVAEQLGIKWRNYINRDNDSSSDYDIRQAATPPKPVEKTSTEESGGVKGLQVDQSFLKSMNLATDYSQLPSSAFLYTLEDAIDDFEKRFLGAVTSPYPPIMNPFKIMHPLGGLAHVLTRPVMVGILGMSSGFKCVSADTRIATVKGILPIGRFATGKPEFSDFGVELLTPDGVKVASHFYDSGISPTKRVTTRFGYDLQGTHNHPILVLDKQGCLIWKRLDEVRVGDYAAINRDTSLFGDEIKLVAPRQGNTIDRLKGNGTKMFRHYTHPFNAPIDLDQETAYVFGLLIGDGGLTQNHNVNFTTSDASLLNAFNDWLSRFDLQAVHRSRYDYAVHNTALRDWLISNGVKGYSYEKEIPECIWVSPKEIVRSFLQGLFDTDGASTYKSKFKVSLSTSSPELAKGVHQLLLQFGIISRRYLVANKFKGDWRVEMRGIEAKKFLERIGFRLDRKQDAINRFPKGSKTNIDSVPYVPLDYHNVSRERGTGGRFGNRLQVVQNSNNKWGMTHEYLSEYVDQYPELQDILKDHYFYDEIKSVEDAGETQCYDVTVPDGHAFISAGFVSHNTTQLSTIVNTLSMQGYHGIVFSPEWTAQRNADRAIQQFGGIRMGDMSLYERFLYEQQQIKLGKLQSDDVSVFGQAPSKSVADNSFRAIAAIRKKMRGKVVYVNRFGASVFDVMAMVNEAAKRMTDAGTPPSYLIFDYAQMAIAPRGFRDWDIGETINLVKTFTIQLGLATFMASQVRKSDSDGVKEGELLTSSSGLGLRDDFFNLFWTTNPTPEVYWNKDKTEQFKAIQIAVTKNSDGKKAEDKENALFLYAGLKRLVIVDDIDDPTYTFDMDETDTLITGEDDED